jgi:GAF domain-containing protein
MISGLNRRLFNIRHNYTNPLEYQRARGLLLVNWAMLLAWLVWLVGSTLPSLVAGEPLEAEILVALAALPVFVFINHQLVQSGRASLGAWLLVAFLGFSLAPPLLEGLSRTTVILFILPIVASAVLLSRRGAIIVAAMVLITLIISAVSQSQITIVERYVPANVLAGDFILVILTLGISLIFLYVFGGSARHIVQDALLDVGDAQAVARFGSQIGASPTQNTIVTQTIDVIRSGLGYAYGQVYLLDDAGSLRRADEHAEIVRISSGNALNQAIRMKQPVLVSQRNEAEQRAHLLPSINSGVAVPLVHEDRVLGVLDIQKATSQPFSAYDTDLLRLLAEQVAVALAQARTLHQLQRDLQTQQTAAERFQNQVITLQQRSQQSVENAWVRYLQARGKAALGYDITPDNILTAASDVPATMRSALTSGDLQVETAGDEQVINVPIKFRDQTLGAMSFSVPKNQEITDRQLEMARIVSNRLALALENTRLFEQSQAQAQRERKASEVSNLLIGATDVASVLNLAAESFNEALGAIQTRIYVERDAWVESQLQGEEL